MPLESELLRGVPELEACLILNAAHVVPGARGAHVGKIQKALVILGVGVIGPAEIKSGLYGETTSAAVLAFKIRRHIINTSYQHAPDNIVGIMTIRALDKEMFEIEKVPPSRLVSLTVEGPPHNHARCPQLQSGGHKGTPINPLGFLRMINIYGTHETDYLGFEDYAVNSNFASDRKTTWTGPGRLENKSVSDICMRSSPIYGASDKSGPQAQNEMDEIKRVAMPGCRFTYAGSQENMNLFETKARSLGVVMETVVIDKQLGRAGHFIVFVVTIL
jgi:hypothetical protein